MSAISVACMDGGGVAVARGDQAAVGVVVDDALGVALPVGEDAETAAGVVGVPDGAVVGVAVADSVAATTDEATGAAGVGVESALAAWPKLARNTEKAISMARNCLTAYEPPEPKIALPRQTRAHYP